LEKTVFFVRNFKTRILSLILT